MKNVKNCDGSRSFVSAGFGYDGVKMPTEYDMTTPVCIVIAVFGIGILLWLALTESGNDFALWVVERLFGI